MPILNKGSDDDPQQSLFSLMCGAAQFAPHVHPDEVRTVQHSCVGRSRRNIITCADEHLDEFQDEVRGLDMSTVNLRGRLLPLDLFIPVVPRGMFRRAAHEVPFPVVGVMINDVLTKRVRSRYGYYYMPKDAGIDTEVLRNPIFRGKQVILLSCGQDVLIETLWWNREALGFFEKIASMGFLAVTGMNFSIFSGECPFSHALNTQKSLRYCEEMDGLGAWTIPHVYAINQPQRERWTDWLTARPHVKLVTINTQLQRNRERDVRQVFQTVEHLLAHTSVSILLHGRGKGLPAEVKKRYADRLHFAASGPLKSALIRRDKSAAEYIGRFIDGLGLPLHI